MITITQIKNLKFDMSELGLDINDKSHLELYKKRLEESLSTINQMLALKLVS